ncbi:hypothetical protein Glove_736g1 [Diversispora epigaea]|uniref:Uncharacterized protein n=1 Tax=Diversispora epigaea TaxID=1348612 RepID=A0A397G8F5_9GLOM|nr:hypothetical protein Glove_736g1 [Diversispora epigaea]
MKVFGTNNLRKYYVYVGGIRRRNKSDAKQLLGYLPILKAKDKSEKKSKDFKKLVRLTFHNSMKFLLDPLFAEKGINLEVDNKTFWFFPRISTIICDWPEAATFSLVYKSTNSNFPCHFCLISKTLLADTDLSDVTFRNNENMQEYFYNNAGQDVSLENIPNYFWSLPIESIKIDDEAIRKRMKKNIKKLEKGETIEFEERSDEESESEEESEEESSEEEKKGKEREEREEEEERR